MVPMSIMLHSLFLSSCGPSSCFTSAPARGRRFALRRQRLALFFVLFFFGDLEEKVSVVSDYCLLLDSPLAELLLGDAFSSFFFIFTMEGKNTGICCSFFFYFSVVAAWAPLAVF